MLVGKAEELAYTAISTVKIRAPDKTQKNDKISSMDIKNTLL
jgi:hypothetical protein